MFYQQVLVNLQYFQVKNGSIRYVLPTGFGKSAVFSDVPEELVVRAIEG